MPGLSIEDLPAMSPAELRAAWREQYRKPAPDVGPDLLRRGIAYRLQVRVHGGLTPATKRAIAKAHKRLEQTGAVSSPRDLSIKPGTRLVREWQGKTYHVLVLDTGFEFDNRRYNSLSHIAREITGVHWSGPRFFGLKKRKAPPKQGKADG